MLPRKLSLLLPLSAALLSAPVLSRHAAAADAQELSQSQVAEALKKIRADGIDGALILCGPGSQPAEAAQAFIKLAGGGAARVVLVRLVGSEAALAEHEHASSAPRLLAAWRSEGGATLTEFVIDSRAAADAAPLGQAFSGATGIWLDAASPAAAQWLRGTALARSCRHVLTKGGVLGLGPPLAAAAGSKAFASSGDDALSFGLDFLPDAAIELESDSAAEPGNGDRRAPARAGRLSAGLRTAGPCVGYTLGRGAALAVRGRLLEKLGAGSIRIEHAATESYSAETVTLAGERRYADLTALRRYAWQRRLEAFPPRQLRPPQVEKGTLIIVGGGGMPRGLGQKFVELAGGKQASIVVIPISMPDPLPERDSAAETFRRLGAKEVTVLTGRTPQEVDRPESLAALRRATGIWFGGGRQWRFIDAYEGTQAGALMHDVLSRGGVIGGSSAGASIQGEYMARGNPLGPMEIMAPGYERGLGFLPGTAIDQHFTQRKRFADMAALVHRYPQLLGIGIDETTALIVRGSVAEVVGQHRVCFYDRSQDDVRGGQDFVSVFPGGKYDLAERKVLDGGTPPDGVAPVEDPLAGAGTR